VNKTAASAAQFLSAFCFVLYNYSFQLHEHKQKLHIHFFYKNNFIRTQGSFFAQNLRTN